MNVLSRIAVGVSVAVLLFGLWRGGVWLDSLMTLRTPLYFTLHSWVSAIVCPCCGLLAGALYDK
jgi:hypothetical protein